MRSGFSFGRKVGLRVVLCNDTYTHEEHSVLAISEAQQMHIMEHH